MLLLQVEEWIKILSRAVCLSWFHGLDRDIVIDEDREKIDGMIVDLRAQALEGFFGNTNESLRLAMREYWVLSYTIENARLKPQ